MSADVNPRDNSRLEHCSIEVSRWGEDVWVTIRSEESVGKAVALTPTEARELAHQLQRSASSTLRPIRDEPQA